MRLVRLVVVCGLAAASWPAGPAVAAEPHAVTAAGIPAVLNGIAAIDVHAVADAPLAIPAPAGHAVLALQSTFDPPGPARVLVTLWCAAVEPRGAGAIFYGSGPGSDGATWHISVSTERIVGHVGWSTLPSHRPCGAPAASIPLIGAAAITP